MASQIILVTLAAIIQGTTVFNITGIKPNLTLLVLISLRFFVASWLEYFILVLVAILFLRSNPTQIFSQELIIFLLVVLIGYFLKEHSPWQPFFNNFVLLIIATAALSFHNGINIFLTETVYNLFLGMGIFYGLKLWYAR